MKTFLRSLITALFLLILVECVAIGVIAPTLPRVAGLPTLHVKRTLTLPATKELEVNNKEGWTRIRGSSVSSILVTADVRLYVSPKTSSTEAILSETTCITSQVRKSNDPSGNTCTVILPQCPELPDGFETSINYDIQVPIGTDLFVKSINGNVWVAPGCGKVTIHGGNTDIEVTDAGGKVNVESVNGRIEVSGLVQDATISTVNGSIYVTASGGATRAATANGAIVATLQSPQLQSCELVTKNGSITVLVQEPCRVAVKARTERGAIRCGLPEITPMETSTQQHVETIAREGWIPLTLETLNGNIRIARSN